MLLKATTEIARSTKEGTGSTTALAKKKKDRHHYKKLQRTCAFKELKKMSPDSKWGVSLLPLATSRLDIKRAVDKGKIVTLDGWLSLGQQNVFARGRVEGKSGGWVGGGGEEILLRMKFPLVLIIPLKVGRLLFF